MKPKKPPLIPCAIYTRKSTEEGLDQDFNTLDAQRESGEAFIKSQQHEGWTCLADRYDDGGFTGGNMERPALKRLLADIAAGKVKCVIVYKVDRLSRSLLDFARMMEVFDKHNVAFAAVTQQFNTATSMGRLVLNVLLSFAQFEREIISERTRDKIAAARRKGKWSGGQPLLGYDIASNRKLVVNEDEAVRVRAIFDLYLEHGSLLPTVAELARRKWCNKYWTTRSGRMRGGKAFDRTNLYRLLTNVVYIGRIRHKDETYPGEQAGIVDPTVFGRVREQLARNRMSGGAMVRNKHGALLKGLLRCAPCGCAMTPTHTTRDGTKSYRYYVCSRAQKRGWNTCPSRSVPAGEVERFVVDRLRRLGQDQELLDATITEADRQQQKKRTELGAEARGLKAELTQHHAEVRRLTKVPTTNLIDQLAPLQDRIQSLDSRLLAIRQELDVPPLDHDALARAFREFDPLWQAFTPRERVQAVHLLVERVDFDGAHGKITITLHPLGLELWQKTLHKEKPHEA